MRQLRSQIKEYDPFNNFFYGVGGKNVQRLRESGYGRLFDLLVASGDPYYVMLYASDRYQRYCETQDETYLNEVTQLYQQTIEQRYSYTGAYLLKALGGIENGWAARYIEWRKSSDPDELQRGRFREYWAIEYELKPIYFEEKETFFSHLKAGIRRLYLDMQAIEDDYQKDMRAIREKEEAERRKPPEQKAEEARIADEEFLVRRLKQVQGYLTDETFHSKSPSEQDRDRESFLKIIKQDKKSIKEVLDDRRTNHHPVGKAFLDLAIAEGILPAEERNQYRIREDDPIVIGEASGGRKRSRDDDGSGAGAAE